MWLVGWLLKYEPRCEVIGTHVVVYTPGEFV